MSVTTILDRFNDQGEPQKHGRWGEEEKKHFLEMIKLHLDDSRQWGLFSRVRSPFFDLGTIRDD